MADLHHMPLRGHDLPEAAPPPVKAEVYKNGLGWNWRHACPGPWAPAVDMGFTLWGDAYAVALSHVKRCAR